MRSTTFALSMLCFALNVHAQNDTEQQQPLKQRKNEIGILIEAPTHTLYGGASGFQYKHWIKPNFGYHLSATTGAYNYNSDAQFVDKSGDTVRYNQTNTFVPLGYIGWGVQIQRQFFGKIYLYAALESRIGYGKGRIDEFSITEVTVVQDSFRSFNGSTVPLSSENISILTVDFAPFIGARLPFKRFCLGAEITAIRSGTAHYNYASYRDYSIAIAEFNDLRQRLYLSYRF